MGFSIRVDPDTGDIYLQDGGVQTKIGTVGAVHVHVKADDTATVTGSNLLTNLLGASGNLIALPTAGTGPDTYDVDLSQFNSASIRLVLITSAGVINWDVDVDYYYDDVTYIHSNATLLAAGAGSRGADLPKNDRMARITITAASAGETAWCYISGREVA